MFNIQFGGSNSAQKPVARFYTDDHGLSTLYCCENDLDQLQNFLVGVRTMDQKSFENVLQTIIQLRKA